MARDEQDDDRKVTEALAALGRQMHEEPVSDNLRALAQRLSDRLAEPGSPASRSPGYSSGGEPEKEQPMADHTALVASLEARLLAHRRLLAHLVACLPQADRRALTDWVDARAVMHDGQEDPGAVPAEGAAEALAMADEYRLIAELAATSETSGDGSR